MTVATTLIRQKQARRKTMNELKEAAKAGGKSMTFFGVIAIILGMLAMMMPGLTGVSVVYLLGVIVLVAGIVRMIWALQAGSLGRGLLMFAIGLLTLLAGLALLAHPLFASGVLTIMLAFYFFLDGFGEISAGIKVRPADGWGWLLFGGIVSLLLGLMIWRQFPLSGLWAVGILLGIKLFFIGLIMVTAGSAVRSIAKK
jgi:uncharacterized membrane protein HdeD (DUF308 family)